MNFFARIREPVHPVSRSCSTFSSLASAFATSHQPITASATTASFTSLSSDDLIRDERMSSRADLMMSSRCSQVDAASPAPTASPTPQPYWQQSTSAAVLSRKSTNVSKHHSRKFHQLPLSSSFYHYHHSQSLNPCHFPLHRFICCSSVKWNQLVNDFTYRSHSCGQLRAADQGKDVCLCGWVQYNRGGRFIALRDAYGITQLAVPEAAANEQLTSKIIAKIPLESVVFAKGIVKRRPNGQENKHMATGEIEVILSDLKVIGEANSQLPFQIRSQNKPKEPLRLKHRYLDLRTKEMQYNLRLRSQFVSRVREFFNAYNFVEVETPTLFKRTPGGAQEFVVPTQEKSKFYSLVQSPQQMKQLLMMGGIDRYYQIARCYRDEGTKEDRQPEFTQIDIEVSFVRRSHVMNLIEQLLLNSWPPNAGKIRLPFPRITYADAMKHYGTDKPDVRFEMRIHDLTEILDSSEAEKIAARFRTGWKCKAIRVPSGSKLLKDSLSRLRKEFRNFCKDISFEGKLIGVETTDDLEGNDNWNRLSLECREQIQAILELNQGDYLWLAVGDEEKTTRLLGRVRVEVAETLSAAGYPIFDNNDPCFVWVHEFPLFLPADGTAIKEVDEEEDEESGGGGGGPRPVSGGGGQKWQSCHHPFTAPRESDRALVYTDPGKVIGEHFDLVLNGEEVGGGSIRINDPVLQKYVMCSVLGLSDAGDEMHYFFEALESGCPPHGGIALGLDRLMAIISPYAESIRDVIAFPKSSDCRDLMTGAPSVLDQRTRSLYHLGGESVFHVSPFPGDDAKV